MVTITDVANLARVSPATVSRYFNNRALLRDDTAKRVEDAINKLQFSPNPVAAGLRTKRSGMIACIIPTLNNLYYIELFSAIQRRCTQHGYSLCMYSIEEDSDILRKLTESMSEYQFEGVIICYLDEPQVIPTLLELQQRIPIVLLTASDEREQFSTVCLDAYTATYNATKYYISKGYKHIGFVSGGYENNLRIIISEKLRGYEKAVSEAGLASMFSAPRGNLAAEAADGLTAGVLGAQHLMSGAVKPEAIVCTLDIVALGCVRYLREQGYRVPEDVEVAGFSGSTLTDVYAPYISSIVQPLDSIAASAVRFLVEQIHDPYAPKKTKRFDAALRTF